MFLARTWMGTRIEQSIRHEYDIRLTTYRNELERDKALALERLRSDLAEMQATQATAAWRQWQKVNASHTKSRLEAVALFWSEIVKLKSSIPEILHFTNVIVPEEYQLLVEREDFRERVTAATNSDLLFNVDEPANSKCPPLWRTPGLYACFFSNRQIIGRILNLFSEGLETGKLAPWMEEQEE